MQILLVRTPHKVVRQGYVGIGWSRVDFSACQTADEAVRAIGNIGRRKNTVRRFFNLAKGDIVLVPLHRSVAVGMVSGEKRFAAEAAADDACNQVAVAFFCGEDGEVIQIPRAVLSQGLESRLKIRMTVTRLNDFQEEIETIIRGLQDSGSYRQNSYLLRQEDEAKEAFKRDLLASLTNGNTWLAAGGNSQQDALPFTNLCLWKQHR